VFRRGLLSVFALCLLLPAAAAAAEPTLTLSATDAEVGSPVQATATLADGAAPTGTISFEAFAANDPTCAGTAVFTDGATVDDNGDYLSGNFNPGAAGTYHWSATYSGDENNDPKTSACAAASVITQATPNLGTVATSATIGSAISDTATISGGVSPGGEIVFKAFGPADATCAGAPAFEVAVPVSGNGNYGSGSFTPAGAGIYRWTAGYGGDADNAAATSVCNAANETSTVAKGSPSLLTTAANAPVGSPISDSATISAGFSPTGQLTFKVFGPSDVTCAGTALFTGNATVSGNGSYGSGNFTPASAGAYRWTASYDGDANNNSATSACNAANETSTVAKASPSLSTTAANATIGSAISDSATITAGFSPGGQLTFKVFGPGDTNCTGTALATLNVTVAGNAAYPSGNFTPATAGAYRWAAVYSGDANNNSATSACNAANETSTVAKAAPAIVTTAASAPVGFAISDSATLSGGFSPTGQLTFKAFGPSDVTCANAPAFESTVAVSGNAGYGSGPFNGALLGAYRWTVTYSGDANNAGATSGCGAVNETSTVGAVSPTLASKAANATIGSPISDSATLSGGFSPTGQLTFKAFGPNNGTCTGAAAFTATVPVNGNGTYGSGDFNGPLLGAYRWTVFYAGDANNNAATSVCNAANETSTVSKFAPALSVSASSATIGAPVAEIATFSGGSQPTGQILLRAYGPDDAGCSGPAAFSLTLDVTPGNGTYASGAFTPAKVGSYSWTASYSGDAKNEVASSTCNAPGSISTIAQAAPTISAKASASALAIGVAARDTASLAGGFQPTGTLSFRLFGPGDSTCIAPPVFTVSTPVSANGTFSSTGFAPAAPGQYRFIASYSGDAGNSATATPCTAPGQAFAVNKRAPGLSAKVSLLGGRRIASRATLAGAAAPRGKLLFQIFGPDNSRCKGKPVLSEKVAVHGGGSYKPAVFRARRRGVYRLTVAYAGDAWNKPARSGCNAAGQSVRIR
jgi:hypothetical protein